MGLEDSREWHRDHAQQMDGEPWDRAVLVSCKQHYIDLQNQFPNMKHYWEDPEATFGEQLVFDGFDADSICLGDELQSEYGPLRLKVTCPRLCCFRVDHRYPTVPPIKHSGSPGTVRQWCSANGRGGFMCRVVHPGTVMEGDRMRVDKRPHPEYPLSKLAGMVFSKTPLHVDFTGTDDELSELCGMDEDLCHHEWRGALVHYRDSLAARRPLQVHESLGTPIPFEEGKALVAGRWCCARGGGVGACPGLAADGALAQREVDLKWDGEVLQGLAEDAPAQRCLPRNEGGHFALEVVAGGFPHFPRFAYMTRSSDATGIVSLVFSTGGKWFREPEA